MGEMPSGRAPSTPPDRPSLGRQGIAYLAVGASTALLELLLFQGLYQLAGVPVALANVIAVAAATVANFLLNRGAAFKSSANIARSAARYALLFAFNLALGTAAIAFLVGHGVSSLLAKVVVQGCIALWNFFLYRRFVFV